MTFLLKIPHFNSGLKYSIQDSRTCEAALTLAGFYQCTFDWNSKLKSTWNEAICTLILQHWEKCYTSGGADEYLIDAHFVTPQNKFLIPER
ncbi:hypothetical protein DFH28DRAFT_887513 [Melampsora americana]|nr:hypothetical protein DFH28DRAFT_887513 [Melampsora americana]